jgi:hypothetical protein
MIPVALTELPALVNGPTEDPVSNAQIFTQRVGDTWARDSNESGDRFGDNIKPKGENMLRIGFQNLGGFL